MIGMLRCANCLALTTLVLWLVAACASTPPASSATTSPASSATTSPAGSASAGAPADHADASTHPNVRTDLHCTQKTADDEAACTKKGAGCRLGAPLHCMGTQPPPYITAQWQKEYETSSAPCACTCPEDQKRCSEVP